MIVPSLLKWVLMVASVVVATPVAALALIIALAPGVSEDEVDRVAAPGGDFDAVLIENNGGATTSFGYKIYVVPSGAQAKGARVAFLYGAIRNSSAYGANLRWELPNRLHIEFLQTKSAELEQPTLSLAGQIIRVELRSGVNDPSAPAGGMLYNIRGRN